VAARLPRLPGLVALRFHLRVGARLAIRVSLPPVVAAFAAGYLLGPDWIYSVGSALFRGGGGARLAVPLLALTAATAAARRIGAGVGAGGWMRQLPVDGAMQRRALVAAAAVAQAPLLAVLAALAAVQRLDKAVAVQRHLRPLAPAALVAVCGALALAALAAAELAVPARRAWRVRAAALAAAVASCSPDRGLMAVGAVLLVAGDLAAGGLPRRCRSRWRRWGSATVSPARTAAGPPGEPANCAPAVSTARASAGLRSRMVAALWAAMPEDGALPGGAARWSAARVAWRAVSWRLFPALAGGVVPLAAAAMFRRNDGLTAAQRLGAAVFGGGAGMAILVATLAALLAARRPAWPWARSLPWSARRRVAGDAALLGAAALPVALAAAGFELAAGAVLLALLPPLAVTAAGLMRRGGGGAGGDDGARVGRGDAEVRQPVAGAGGALWLGLLAAGALALVPWLAVALLALTPVALGAAAARERRERAGRWSALRHLAAGDPQSWSGE
jgi:hypothetical protein